MSERDLSGIWFTDERERSINPALAERLLWPWATEQSARP